MRRTALVCLSWSFATTLALLSVTAVDNYTRRYTMGGLYFFLALPIGLGFWEGVLMAWPKGVPSVAMRLGCLSGGMLWGFSLILGAVLWGLLGVADLLLVNRLRDVFFTLVTSAFYWPGLIASFELVVGLLQWPLLSGLPRRRPLWIAVRPVASTLAIASAAAWSGYEGGAVPSWMQATLMGLVGGCIKGLGVAWIKPR